MKIFYFSNKLSIFSKYFEVSDVIEPRTAINSLIYWTDIQLVMVKKKGTSSDEDVPLCGSVTDLRTFYEDYLKCIEFCEWLKEKAERQ